MARFGPRINPRVLQDAEDVTVETSRERTRIQLAEEIGRDEASRVLTEAAGQVPRSMARFGPRINRRVLQDAEDMSAETSRGLIQLHSGMSPMAAAHGRDAAAGVLPEAAPARSNDPSAGSPAMRDGASRDLPAVPEAPAHEPSEKAPPGPRRPSQPQTPPSSNRNLMRECSMTLASSNHRNHQLRRASLIVTTEPPEPAERPGITGRCFAWGQKGFQQHSMRTQMFLM
ncbi:hypothetical protein T484DRAFT_1793518 [Baffinella frigidus]|jgi:hypothetical protein|nr:hypothetical protein T484DRAFT_1793518 [Cryptophyta sp. CCMP2293]